MAMLTKQELLETFKVLTTDHAEKFNGGFSYLQNCPIDPHSVGFTSMIFGEQYFSNGYELNDPNRICMIIEQIGEDLFEVTSNTSSLSIEPTDEAFKALSFGDKIKASKVKIPFRKIKGSSKKVIEQLLKFQEKRLGIVKENIKIIKGVENSNIKDLL